jgi:hypothetical protein
MTLTPTRSTEIVLRFTWDDAFDDLHASWHRDVAVTERAHRRVADRLRRRHAVVTTLLVILALATAGGAFASVRAQPGWLARAGIDREQVSIAIGTMAALVALLAIVQAIAGFRAAAERHRLAAIRYGALEREMAATAATPRHARPQPDRTLNQVRERIDRYAEESPAVARRVRRAAAAALEEPAPARGPAAWSETFETARLARA